MVHAGALCATLVCGTTFLRSLGRFHPHRAAAVQLCPPPSCNILYWLANQPSLGRADIVRGTSRCAKVIA